MTDAETSAEPKYACRPRQGSDERWNNLQNFGAFIAVIEQSSVAGAARTMNRAPSAVARSIRMLEAALGTELIDRSAASLVPTEAGRLVHTRACRMIDEINQASRLLAGDTASRATIAGIVHALSHGRKLQMLDLLARTRTISETAARMGVTRSATSMSLSRLEEIVGERLFRRVKHGLKPTPTAGQLLQHIHRIDAEVRHMEDELASHAKGLTGTVVVGMLAMARARLFPAAVAQVMTQYPGVKVRVLERTFRHLVEALRSGEVDFTIGVTRNAREHDGLEVEPLLSDTLIPLARADNPVFTRDALTLADLGGERWILPRPEARGWAQLTASFAAEGVPLPEPAVETSELEIIRQLLLSTDMIAVASLHQFEAELRDGTLRAVPVPLEASRRDIALIRRAGAQLSPAALRLIEAVKQQAQTMPPPSAASA